MPEEAVGKANPNVPRPIAYTVWVSLAQLKASDKRPAVLTRAAPTTHAQDADEDGAKAPPRPRGIL